MGSIELTVIVDDMRTIRAQLNRGETKFQGTPDNLYLETIRIFENWLRLRRLSSRKELEVLGSYLYKVLFRGEVEDSFKRALVTATQDKEHLRVQLSFSGNAADLASLPWEYLYYPDTEYHRGFFLATRADLVLSRYMPLEEPQSITPIESSLRILLVISDPEDEHLEPVVAEPIIEAMEKLVETNAITFGRLEKPTIDNFIDKLEEFQPHVLHFFGHGRYDEERKEAEIALFDIDERRGAWLTDRMFADCFTRARPVPRLVFLHLGESNTKNFKANFERLAPELIRTNIQAVVAMRYPIETKAATVFCRTFYGELAKGESVDVAVQMGRHKITTSDANTRVFGTPVLYMQTSDGLVQPKASIASKGARRGGGPIPPAKQEVEPTKTGPLVSSTETGSASIVKTTILAGKKTIDEIKNPSVDKLKMYQMLSKLRDQLLAKNTLEEMRGVLSNKYFEVDLEFQPVIYAMMRAVEDIIL